MQERYRDRRRIAGREIGDGGMDHGWAYEMVVLPGDVACCAFGWIEWTISSGTVLPFGYTVLLMLFMKIHADDI